MDFNEALAKYTEKHLAAGGDSSPQSLDALYYTCLGIYEREGMDALESFVNQDFKLKKTNNNTGWLFLLFYGGKSWNLICIY